MRTFYKPKPKKELNTQHNNHLRLKLLVSFLLFTFLVLFFGLFFYLIVEYKNTHTWTFQTPLIIERNHEIISPISSQSAGLNIAYAQEYTNPFDEKSPKGVAWEAVNEQWGVGQWSYFEELINRESHFNPYAINPSSGACGIFQALPCSKLGVELWDYEGQIKWGINYILERYKTPKDALEFHNENGWY